MKKTIVVTLLCLMLTFVSGQAMASSATATAQLGWSIDPGSTGISWVTGSPAYDYSAGAASMTYGTATEVTMPTYHTATLTDAAATGKLTTGTNNLLSSDSSVGPIAAPPLGTYAVSYAKMIGDFTANASGTVKFDIPWYIAYTMTTTAGPDSYSHAISSVSVFLTRTTFMGNVEQQFLQYISDTKDTPGSLNNLKSNVGEIVSSYFRHGEKGHIELTAYTQVDAASSVPVPAVVWLLGSGLLGLAGIKRRSFKS